MTFKTLVDAKSILDFCKIQEKLYYWECDTILFSGHEFKMILLNIMVCNTCDMRLAINRQRNEIYWKYSLRDDFIVNIQIDTIPTCDEIMIKNIIE